MGAFDDAANILLPDPSDTEGSAAFRRKWGWDAHEQVILKGAYTAGDLEAVSNAVLVSGKRGESIMQAGATRIKLLDRLILDWTFARNGVKVPKTLDAIRRLPANYTTPILEACDKLASAMNEEEQEDFLDFVNGHSSDDSVPMKLLQKRS